MKSTRKLSMATAIVNLTSLVTCRLITLRTTLTKSTMLSTWVRVIGLMMREIGRSEKGRRKSIASRRVGKDVTSHRLSTLVAMSLQKLMMTPSS